VTEQRSPIDSALDLLVYAPVGLALTAAEELPKLAAKGRAQVEGQVSMARMLGQFAVAQGRKEIEKRLGGSPQPRPAPRERPPGRPEGSTANGSVDAGDDASYERLAGRPPGAATKASGPAASEHGEPGTSGGLSAVGNAESEASVIDVDFGTATRSSPEAGGLAIPGYDSLSASQVVQRLAGLSQEELAAVGEYEAAHRGRRTILTRVGQLKG
jgi:hypothetical protein